MKKFGIISAAFLLMGMLFGSQVMAQGQIDFRTNSAQQCANVGQDGFTATFSFSGIQATEITNEKGTFSEIKMDGTYPSGNVGEPSLPAANQLIAVPFGAKNVTIEVKNFSTTTYRLADYGIKTVMPQQASVSKSQKPEDVKFAYSEKAYAANSMSQRPIATLEMKGTMRGIQVGSLTINPVNYNPATNNPLPTTSLPARSAPISPASTRPCSTGATMCMTSIPTCGKLPCVCSSSPTACLRKSCRNGLNGRP